MRCHYQWIVLHDFVERITAPGMVAERAGRTDVKFYKLQDAPFMPLEFAGAAYRLGHTMIRESYSHNRVFRPGSNFPPGTLQLLFQFTGPVRRHRRRGPDRSRGFRAIGSSTGGASTISTRRPTRRSSSSTLRGVSTRCSRRPCTPCRDSAAARGEPRVPQSEARRHPGAAERTGHRTRHGEENRRSPRSRHRRLPPGPDGAVARKQASIRRRPSGTTS